MLDCYRWIKGAIEGVRVATLTPLIELVKKYSLRPLSTLSYYFKLALLSIRQTPLLSALVVVIMAIGISAPAIFESIHQAWAHNPLADKNDRLFVVQLQAQETDPAANPSITTIDNLPLRLDKHNTLALRDNAISLRQSPITPLGLSVRNPASDLPEFWQAARAVDRDFFAMFGLEFIQGDAWPNSADSSAEHVAVIGETLSQRLFGDTSAIGKTLILEQHPFRVAGVVRDWNPRPNPYDVDNHLTYTEGLFIPFAVQQALELPFSGNQFNDSQGTRRYQFWVELEPAQQQAYRDFLQNYIEAEKSQGRFPLPDAAYALRSPQQWLAYRGVVTDEVRYLAVVSLLFLALCLVNSVSLLLTRILRGSFQIAARRALGAGKWDIYMQASIEILLLGLLAGLLGWGVATLGIDLLAARDRTTQMLMQNDGISFMTTLILTLSAALLAGIYPVYKACKTPPALMLKN